MEHLLEVQGFGLWLSWLYVGPLTLFLDFSANSSGGIQFLWSLDIFMYHIFKIKGGVGFHLHGHYSRSLPHLRVIYRKSVAVPDFVFLVLAQRRSLYSCTISVKSGNDRIFSSLSFFKASFFSWTIPKKWGGVGLRLLGP